MGIETELLAMAKTLKDRRNHLTDETKAVMCECIEVNMINEITSIIAYMDEFGSDADPAVIKGELGEILLRHKNEYAK